MAKARKRGRLVLVLPDDARADAVERQLRDAGVPIFLRLRPRRRTPAPIG